jgi:Glutaminase
MPTFHTFRRDVWELFQIAKKTSNDGKVDPHVKRAMQPDEEAFAVAMCTTDGQMLSYGSAATQVPLMETVKPLLYALGLKDVGRRVLHSFVGKEPTAMDPSGFDLLPTTEPTPDQGAEEGGAEEMKDSEGEDSRETPSSEGIINHPSTHRRPNLMPYNPFVDSGTLAICAILGRAHLPRDQRTFGDLGGRFNHVITHITEWAGGRKIGYNNPMYLCKKSASLKVHAVSHYIKGMDVYPKTTMPSDNANFYHQCCSIQCSPTDLSVIAATFANHGVCPTTGVRCIDKSS